MEIVRKIDEMFSCLKELSVNLVQPCKSLKHRPYLHVEPSQKSRQALREHLGEILNHWTLWKPIGRGEGG